MNLNAVIPISFSHNGRCALIVIMQKLFESLQPLIMCPNQTEAIRLTNEFNSFIEELGLSAQEIDDTVNFTWNHSAISEMEESFLFTEYLLEHCRSFTSTGDT